MRSRQCDDRFGVGDVDFGGFGAVALSFDRGDGVLQAFHVEIGDHQIGAVLRQRDAGGPAKPAAATDYHNLAPVEPEQRREVNRIESRKLARTWPRGNLVPPDGPRPRGMGTAAKPPPEPGT